MPLYRPPAAGGGGGGVARVGLGKTAVGALTTTYSASSGIMVYKKITLAAPGLLTGIAFHGRTYGSAYTDFSAGVLDVSGGAPNDLLAFHAPGYDSNAGGGRGAMGDLQWTTIPVIAWLPAADYWIGVGAGVVGTTLQIHYDTGGSDITITRVGASGFIPSGPSEYADRNSNAVTTFDHSIYANVLT